MTSSIFADEIKVVVDAEDAEPITLKFSAKQQSEVYVYLTRELAERLTIELQKAVAVI